MTLDRPMMVFAALMILLSAALSWFVSPYWLALTAFVGLNMLQAAFTGFCPAAKLISKLGISSRCAIK